VKLNLRVLLAELESTIFDVTTFSLSFFLSFFLSVPFLAALHEVG
jgi:hypothetical protein